MPEIRVTDEGRERYEAMAEAPEAEDPEAEAPEAEDPEAEDREAEAPEAEDPEAEEEFVWDVMRELTSELRTRIAGGYTGIEDLAEFAADFLDGEDGEDDRPDEEEIEALIGELWRERLAEEAGWEGELDPDRLTVAFNALDDAGITAREDFTCCLSCGMSEIGDERSPGARGFVFFHSQAVDSAVETGSLSLYYGGFDGSEDTTRAIGHEVVAAVAAQGLRVEWSGSPDRAVEVKLDWRKRVDQDMSALDADDAWEFGADEEDEQDEEDN
ncbi:DUF6891 domain-containing protein [Streptomyces sp. NPDC051018]|uniref:DUF6891 domain-containing protein n=1 Tax=Streptomyces sp. NPDC051018 TaxID=3365639 RepID=UPI003794D22B